MCDDSNHLSCRLLRLQCCLRQLSHSTPESCREPAAHFWCFKNPPMKVSVLLLLMSLWWRQLHQCLLTCRLQCQAGCQRRCQH